MEKVTRNGITYFLENGSSYSIDPPNAQFGFTYWSYMIPPFTPKNMLMLGGAGNTIGQLSKRVHGDFPLTIVDNQPCENVGDSVFVQKDALDFIRESKDVFDFIVVDLFKGEDVPKFVFEEVFIESLIRVSTGVMVLNLANTDSIEAYQRHLKLMLIKKMGTNAIYFLTKTP